MTHDVKTGRKARKPGFWTTEKRQEIVKQLFSDLDEWEKEQAPAYIAQIMSTHDNYHGRNPLMIAMQDPEATDVDSYKAWLERGRRVMGKGYQVNIIRPHIIQERDPDDPSKTISKVIGYDYYPVYDVRWTVENEVDIVKQWHVDHPEGKW
jgi:hypothetical protein